MDNSFTVVANTQPAYVAVPHYDENNNIVEIDLEPIVAWKIIHIPHLNETESTAIPITTEEGLPKSYAIYYSDTKRWTIPTQVTGIGPTSLIKHFIEKDENVLGTPINSIKNTAIA